MDSKVPQQLRSVRSSLALAAAGCIVDAALAIRAREGLLPLAVAVIDAGGHLVAFKREDGCGLLRIALANLLGNALKYTRNASPARIEFGEIQRAGGLIEFFVRDNGAGFDMAHADRLFQPFQRMHGAREFEGTGIGLATVQRVMAKHGGTIRGEARPGAGATFYLTLPA